MSNWSNTGTPVTIFTGGGDGTETLQQIIDMVRYRLNNFELPYLWLDNELVFSANIILNTICREGRILEDSITPSVCQISTVVGKSDYQLHPPLIYIKSAKIRTQETLTLDTKPSVAWSVGDTITGASSLHTCEVIAKLTDYTYTVKRRTGVFTTGEILSNGLYTAIPIVSSYPFSDSTTNTSFLEKYTKPEMDRYYSSWRGQPPAQPLRYMLDYNSGYMTLYSAPDDIYIVDMSVIRYPLTQLSSVSMSEQYPEIDPKYINTLVEGICYQAYQKRGDDTYDKEKAAAHYSQFRKELGQMKIQNNMYEANGATASPVGGFI